MPAGTFTAQPDPQIKQVNSVHRPLYYRIEKQADVAASPVEIAQARVTITYNGSLLANSLTGETIELIIDNIEDLGSDLYAIEFSISQQLKDQLDPTSVLSLPAIFRSLDSVTSAVEEKSFALVSVTVSYYYFENVSGRLVLDIATGEDDTSDTCMVGNFLEQTLGQRGLAGPNVVWAGLVLSEYLLLNEHVDAGENNIAGRALTAGQKQYIFDTALKILWPRFGASTATIVQRTAFEMADAMIRIGSTDTGALTTLITSTQSMVDDVLFVLDGTIQVAPNPSAFPSVSYSELIAASTQPVGNEWGKSDLTIRRTTTAADFEGPIFNYRHGNLVLNQTGFFEGSIPTLPENDGLFGPTGLANNNNHNRFSDWIDDDTITRAITGINMFRCLFTEQRLKDMIDLVHANRFNLVAGSNFDWRLNSVGGINQSALVAADPIYGDPVTGKLAEIAADGGVTVQI